MVSLALGSFGSGLFFMPRVSYCIDRNSVNLPPRNPVKGYKATEESHGVLLLIVPSASDSGRYFGSATRSYGNAASSKRCFCSCVYSRGEADRSNRELGPWPAALMRSVQHQACK